MSRSLNAIPVGRMYFSIAGIDVKRKNFGRPVRKKSRRGKVAGLYNKCGHRSNPRKKN